MKKILPSRKWKRIFIFFFLLLLVGTTIHFGGPVWMEEYLQRVLPDSSSGYDIHWDSLVILPFSRGLRLENLRVEKKPQEARGSTGSVSRFVLSVHSLELTGISLSSLFSEQGICIEDVTLSDWHFSIWGKISGSLFASDRKSGSRSLRIGKVRLHSGRIRWDSGTGSLGNTTRIRSKVPRLTFSMPRSPGFAMKGWMNRILMGSIGRTTIEVGALNSDMRISGAYLDDDGKSIVMTDLQLTPRLPEYRYSRQRGYQTDRIEVSIPFIRAKIDPIQALEATGLNSMFTEILLQRPSLKIFRDRRLQRKKGTRRRKPFPQQVLRRIPLSIHIPAIRVRDGFVSYAEHLAGSDIPGKVTFSRVSAQISNLAVGPLGADEYPDTRCAVNCLVQESIPTELRFSMEPSTPRFRFSGKVSDVSLKALNPLLVPLAFLRMERGRMEGLKFNFHGDHRSIRGTTQARYHDLKVTLLKRSTPAKRRGLATFFMNRLILPHNPSKRSRLRIARVRLQRSPGRSFFNWLWRAVLDGMKRSAGI